MVWIISLIIPSNSCKNDSEVIYKMENAHYKNYHFYVEYPAHAIYGPHWFNNFFARVYNINTKSVDWFNLEYLCNCWLDSCEVFSIGFRMKKLRILIFALSDLFMTFPFKFKVMLHITSQRELDGWNNIKITAFQHFYALFLKGTFSIGSNRHLWFNTFGFGVIKCKGWNISIFGCWNKCRKTV